MIDDQKRLRTCAWHECGRRFTPQDLREKFCCPQCRIKRAAWKAKRGGPLVDMLLANDYGALVAAKKKIRKEIDDATAATD